jgi:hypothetical protein
VRPGLISPFPSPIQWLALCAPSVCPLTSPASVELHNFANLYYPFLCLHTSCFLCALQTRRPGPDRADFSELLESHSRGCNPLLLENFMRRRVSRSRRPGLVRLLPSGRTAPHISDWMQSVWPTRHPVYWVHANSSFPKTTKIWQSHELQFNQRKPAAHTTRDHTPKP